jgi:hypothetical protein
MEEKALEYIEGGYDTVPSVVGLAVHLNVSKSTLYKWAEDNRGTISDTLELCNDKQHMMLMSKGLTNEFNSTITKLMLANHGHSEKTSTDITSGGEKIQNDWHVHPVSNDK